MGINRVVNEFKCVGISIHGAIKILIYHKPRTSKHKVVVEIANLKAEHPFNSYEEANTYFIKVSKEIKSGNFKGLIHDSRSNQKLA